MKWFARLLVLPFALFVTLSLKLAEGLAESFWEAADYWRKKLYK